jgi:hypothetical protein
MVPLVLQVLQDLRVNQDLLDLQVVEVEVRVE